jgi:hypothetical protein
VSLTSPLRQMMRSWSSLEKMSAVKVSSACASYFDECTYRSSIRRPVVVS